MGYDWQPSRVYGFGEGEEEGRKMLESLGIDGLSIGLILVLMGAALLLMEASAPGFFIGAVGTAMQSTLAMFQSTSSEKNRVTGFLIVSLARRLEGRLLSFYVTNQTKKGFVPIHEVVQISRQSGGATPSVSSCLSAKRAAPVSEVSIP